MDSLTHFALGACIGEALLGRTLGRKALLWGGIAQNLPDLDVLAALWLPAADNLLAHRGITHSLPVGLAAAAGLSLAANRRMPAAGLRTWLLFFALQLAGHDLLDTCNAYGTALLEPFSGRRFSFHLLYVADPLFTLPVLVAALLLLRTDTVRAARQRTVALGLLWALAYLGLAGYAKARIDRSLAHSPGPGGAGPAAYFSTPTPFNALLWYAVAAAPGGYRVGYRSVFEPAGRPTAFTFFPRADSLLRGMDGDRDVALLRRFAGGYYTVERQGDTTHLNVLRFGQVLGWQRPGAPFAFRYRLGGGHDNALVVQRGRFQGWNARTLGQLYHRIFLPQSPDGPSPNAQSP